MRTALAVIAGRLARVASRLRGGGSAIPGWIALRVQPHFLQRAVAGLPLGVVFVSGSNGKSTTTQMLVAVLRAHGVRVFTNPSGANLPQGIASAMIARVGLDGRLDRARVDGGAPEIAVLEVDEAYGPRLADALTPHSVLLINLQVDQLNRFHEPDRVLRMLKSFAHRATRHLIVNADDRNLVGVATGHPGGVAVSAFAADPALLATNAWLARGDNPARAAEAASAGIAPATVLTAWTGRDATVSVDGSPVPLRLPARGLHYAVDAAAAVATARALLGDRFDPAAAASGLGGMQPVYGRGETLRHGDEDIEVLMMKNPPSLQVNLDALEATPEQLLVAVDEGTPDPSWIYASDLSKLGHVDVLTGTKCWQFATRFDYGDIEVGEIIPELGPALDRFLALPRPASGVKTMLVNYEQMMLIRKRLGYLDLEGAG